MSLRVALVVVATLGCSFPAYQVQRDDDAAVVVDAPVEVGASCSALPDGALLACGTCGRIDCVDGGFGPCVEPTPAPGAPCGTCGKSKYVCRAPGAVECAGDDDRTDGTDYAFPVGVELDRRTVNRRIQLAVSYAAKHDGALTLVRLVLRRTSYSCGSTSSLPHPDPACDKCTSDGFGGYNCSPSTPIPGKARVQVFRGTPDGKLETKPIASGEIEPSKIPDSSLNDFTDFPLTSTEDVKTGDPLTLVVSLDSTSFGMLVTTVRTEKLGGAPPEHKTWMRNVYPSTSWTSLLRDVAAIDVKMRGCF